MMAEVQRGRVRRRAGNVLIPLNNNAHEDLSSSASSGSRRVWYQQVHQPPTRQQSAPLTTSWSDQYKVPRPPLPIGHSKSSYSNNIYQVLPPPQRLQGRDLSSSLEGTSSELLLVKNPAFSANSNGNNNYEFNQYEYSNNNVNGYYAYTSAPSATADELAATGVWNYMLTLSVFLCVWVLALILPKGCRKQFCNANPRRYIKRKFSTMAAAGFSTSSLGGGTSMMMSSLGGPPAPRQVASFDDASSAGSQGSVHDSTLLEVEKRRDESNRVREQAMKLLHQVEAREQQRHQGNNRSSADNGNKISLTGTTPSGGRDHPSNNSMSFSASFHRIQPSPGHPAIPKLPSAKIINESMQRLKSRGIRLMAHGVASESKRVWIRLEDDTQSLSWQTEFPRQIPNANGDVSLVMMRGAMHRIALPNILYIDVGKKTNALSKSDHRTVPEAVCFSLLTQNGSLDLQANSRLERDALVSCFSMVLDEVHDQVDWRSLYAESPESSQIYSACGTGSELLLPGGGDVSNGSQLMDF